jgi:8-oxo-dGTP pyrophosphatase MutT (NUDIX family)
MPMSEQLRAVRAKVGHDLLMLPAAAGLVFDADGRVLLQRHGDTLRWVAPGGSIEPDETPVDALVREIWEETGLFVEPVSLLGVFGGPAFRVRYRNGDECACVMAAFECRVRSGALRLDGEESLELRYFARDEIDALDLAPWARIVLPAAFANRGRSHLAAPTWTPPSC